MIFFVFLKMSIIIFVIMIQRKQEIAYIGLLNETVAINDQILMKHYTMIIFLKI